MSEERMIELQRTYSGRWLVGSIPSGNKHIDDAVI
jgi:hypothetical protein